MCVRWPDSHKLLYTAISHFFGHESQIFFFRVRERDYVSLDEGGIDHCQGRQFELDAHKIWVILVYREKRAFYWFSLYSINQAPRLYHRVSLLLTHYEKPLYERSKDSFGRN